MHWLVVKAQPVYVSYNLKYQCEALPTAAIKASGGSKRWLGQVLRFAPALSFCCNRLSLFSRLVPYWRRVTKIL